MNAEIVQVPHIVCPYCHQSRFPIDHLVEGVRFGPWYCDSCGKSFSGVRTADGADITLLPRWKRDTKVTLEYAHDPRLRLQVKGTRFSKGDGTEDKEADKHDEYYYEEHTCPTNFLHDCHEVSFDGDADPHGLFNWISTEVKA